MNLLELETSLKDYDWFFSVEENDKEVIVYTEYMNLDIFNTVPEMCNGKRVLIYFVNYKFCCKENFIDEVILL
jgi:hypothetical protein